MSFRARLALVAAAAVALAIVASSTRVAHATGPGVLSRSTTVCGARTYRVRITELKGRGSFQLASSRP